MRYNYVIFQAAYEYYRITYSDFVKNENVEFIDTYPKYGGKLINTLCRLHRSPKINKYIHLPLKNIWNSFFFKNKFSNTNPICFLFSAGCVYLKDFGFIAYLRKKYPDAKFVCFYQDIVESVRNSNIEDVKRIFDLVLSYDPEDCKKYDLVFHNTVFSDFKVPEPNRVENSDVYFVGAAKNRLPQILTIYKQLSDLSMKCDFNIIGVPEAEQIKGEGLHYIKGMSYVENLKHVVKTKVVLEVMQKQATGASLRMWECVNYNKIFLTNNEYAPHYSCYDTSCMHQISEVENISQWIGTPCHYSEHQKESIRPIRLLEFIDDKL